MPEMSAASRIVAANIRALRKGKGWTQAEATERMIAIGGPKWGNANWSAMERSLDGARVCAFPADVLFWLAKLFGVSVGDLFEETPEPVPCPSCGGTGEVLARPDAVEAWIKAARDEYDEADPGHYALDQLLDDYRLHADTGAPLEGGDGRG